MRRATRRSWRGTGPRAYVVVLVAVLAAALVVTEARVSGDGGPGSASAAPHSPPAPTRTVIASIPYWNLGPGTADVEANRTVVDEISPWTYGIGPDAGVTSNVPASDVGTAATSVVRLRALGIPLMPSVSNMIDGVWDSGAVASMLHDRAATTRHVRALTDLAVSQNYAGLDLDYEELQAGDRAAFSDFVRALGTSLHARGKRLSVALFAKTDDAGDDERNVAQDYAAIGAAVDEVRLMTYDYHWETSPPGPISPIGWVHDVLAYATSVIPPEKIAVGLDIAGYDWVGGQAQPISYQQATQLAADHGATASFDPLSQSPWFRYTDGRGRHHEVWFENAASASAKCADAASFGVHTVFLWMFAPPDPALWAGLASPSTTGGTR